MNTVRTTDPLDATDLWSDLRANIAFLKTNAVTSVRLMFGFSWGQHIYSDRWVETTTPLEAVEQAVVASEQNGYGQLGDDNLYLHIAEFEVRVQYSYESDIQLSYSSPNLFVRTVLARWQSMQWMIDGGSYR